MEDFSVLDKPLEDVSREIRIDDDERKKYNEALNELFDAIISAMKKRNDFKELFRQREYVGSFYENLKVDIPNEFDINLELKIPSYVGELEVCHSKNPGFCHLKLNETFSTKPKNEDVIKTVKKLCDKDGFILREKVHRWFESIFDQILNELKCQDKFKIFRSTSGPAITLSVTPIFEEQIKFSVDFVPVFVFPHWPSMVKNILKCADTVDEKKWYAVPKSMYGDPRNFRISFWHQEKHLLLDKKHLKPVLKLIKRLRDLRGWKQLSSYYIKTVFLWCNEEDESIWNKSLGTVFIKMICYFKYFLLEKKCIPFFWEDNYNLLSDMNSYHRENIGNYFSNMVRDIKKNIDTPKYVLSYFNMPQGPHSKLALNTNISGQYDNSSNSDDDVQGSWKMKPAIHTTSSATQHEDTASSSARTATGALFAAGAIAVGAYAIYRALNMNGNGRETRR